MPYDWRRMTLEQRAELLAFRKERAFPWHSPPHWDFGDRHYLLSAACYEHRAIVGLSMERMREYEELLLSVAGEHSLETLAWCVLPNHYHFLVRCDRLAELLKAIGQLHGRTSHCWNGEDNQRGRRVWCNCQDRAMRSERHLYATLNYVHHNAVHHGYVQRWEDWPYSSANAFLEDVGREEAERIWREFPLLDYGKGWDEAGT